MHDIQDEDGMALLMNAVWSGYSDIMQLINASRIDSSRKQSGGMTALPIAASEGDTGAVDMLLGREDVNPDAQERVVAR